MKEKNKYEYYPTLLDQKIKNLQIDHNFTEGLCVFGLTFTLVNILDFIGEQSFANGFTVLASEYLLIQSFKVNRANGDDLKMLQKRKDR